ncbi:hypothetical protein [Dyadobacter jiangsuensis]|uniref:Uncharacterized protein n=1 Tax=Dyadobacter jiangsuensis TaxID=1591085 RepID=A0A2P8FP72_9BACT|nr:hypothetical protein [Dyadobacter jiangsuensis]PSL23489.1 hypothetical protein CLV60_11644 [Dyadobacter jiangsuensis]
MINITGIENDINRETARRAYFNVSFSPEKRGDSVVDGYIQTMTKLASFIAENTEDKELGQQVFDKLREGYRKRTQAWLSATSRCLSSMITGPARFPVRKAEKANSAEHKRSTEMLAYYDNMQKYALSYLKAVDRRKTDKENKTHYFKGLEVVENYDEDRLQLIFDGKPTEEARSLLKKNGFRWSLRFSAWQRQLTDNARRAFNSLREPLNIEKAGA